MSPNSYLMLNQLANKSYLRRDSLRNLNGSQTQFTDAIVASIHRQSLGKKTQKKKQKAQETALQITFDVAKERGHTMQELLQYGIRLSSYLFDGDGLMKSANKSDLTKELEKLLSKASPREPP